MFSLQFPDRFKSWSSLDTIDFSWNSRIKETGIKLLTQELGFKHTVMIPIAPPSPVQPTEPDPSLHWISEKDRPKDNPENPSLQALLCHDGSQNQVEPYNCTGKLGYLMSFRRNTFCSAKFSLTSKEKQVAFLGVEYAIQTDLPSFVQVLQ